MPSNLLSALSYAAKGWPVLPLKAGTKLPLTAHGVNDATTDHDIIRAWFTDTNHNVGIATGVKFYVVDIDPRNGGLEEWDRLQAVHGAMLPTCVVHTGGDGWHFYMSLPDFDVKNGSIGEGIDIKSKGGYVVAPPSVHESGASYVWESTLPPGIGTDWLRNMLPRKADKIVGGGLEYPVDPNDDRPGSRYNASASWEDVLIPHGWSVDHVEGNEVFWTRPGKSSGISATSGYDGVDILYVFTSSTEFDAGTAYTKFAAYAILNHAGDFREAAKELAAVSGTGKAPFTIPAEDTEYSFINAAPEEHFITRYIRWCNLSTDAASEYHEAASLILLAVAAHKTKGMLSTYPGGLPNNLYVLLTGPTTRSRKSTAQKLGLSVVRDSYPVAPLPSRSTTERMIEMLAEKSHLPTVWAPDEFGIKLSEIYQRDFLKGLEELMLTLYDGESYRYEKMDRSVSIEAPHLNILAAATPESLAMAGPGAMVGGLLPRFAVVMPHGLPPAKKVGEYIDLEPEKQQLVGHLKDVLRWSSDHKEVQYTTSALDVLGEAEIRLHAGGASVARLATMLYKVSMLVAIGRMSDTVDSRDAYVAQHIVDRWYSGAKRLQPFLRRKSVDLEFEAQVDSAFRIIKALGGGPLHRSEIASRLRVQKSKLDAIQSALVDWGLIAIDIGPAGTIWETLE